MTLKTNKIEYETFGVQMKKEVRIAFNVRAAQLNLEKREALEECVKAWTRPICTIKGCNQDGLGAKIMAWISNPPNEIERDLADLVIKLATKEV